MTAVAGSRDTRVEDYLNDKLQTIDDLGSLDSLLKQVEQQHDILQQQLSKTEAELERAQKSSKSNSLEILTRASAFQHQNEVLNERLQAVTTSDQAADAVFQFKQGIQNLTQLNIAKGYVSILLEVEALRQKVRSRIPDDLKGALEPYNRLQQLSHDLKSKHDAAEGAAVHLVDFVQATTVALWDEMKSKLMEQFQVTLTKISWPGTEIPDKDLPEFEAGFYKLLMLQKSELDSGLSRPVLAFEALVRAHALRFRYHFEGERPTNRVDKPEWYLTHLANLFDECAPLFSSTIQDILDQNGLSARDAVQEFITAALPVLRRKVDLDMPTISSQGPLSSHLVEELSKFDTLLREEYMYAPYGQDPSTWRGVTHEVLTQNNGEFFQNWLTAEKEFALARYESVITSEDAWALDYDSVELGSTKPTKSAIRLKDLLETITERYRPLVSFSQRLRFLMDIQISVLDQYHDRLQSSVDAFKMLSSSIGRAVHGAKQGSDSVGGVSGLERLCRVYGSAIYLEEFMKDWGEDVFFIELWEELQRRAQQGAAAPGGMSMDVVAGRTSNSITSGDEDGALFDETAGSYRNLRNAVEPMMMDLIMSTLREDLKPYSKINTWHSLDMTDPNAGLQPPPTTELVPVVKSLSAFFDFLHRTLSSALFQRLVRLTILNLQTYLIDNIVQRQQFSEQGGIQFQRDVMELWGVARRVNVDLDNATRKIKETCLLLALPTMAAASADEEGSDDKTSRTLQYVREKMFEDNAQARNVSTEIGLQSLAVNEARDILQRRVENWG